jgi:hypothetical protein
MSGGILSVRDEDYDHFLKLLADDIDSKARKWTLSEVPTEPIRRLYFDLDFLDNSALTEGDIVPMLQIFQKVIVTYYPPHTVDDKLRCIVCTSPSVPVAKAGKTWTKTGVHVIYPDLLVNLTIALQIRFHLVSSLREHFGERECSENPWISVLDRQPYLTGLKMFGNYKCVSCPDCKSREDAKTKEVKEQELKLKNEVLTIRRKLARFSPRPPDFKVTDFTNIFDDEYKDLGFPSAFMAYTDLVGDHECLLCNNTYKVIDDRAYKIAFVLDFKGEVDEAFAKQLKESTYLALKYTSIRTLSENMTPGFDVPKGFPIFVEEDEAANFRNARAKDIFTNDFIRNELMQSDLHLSDYKGILQWKSHEHIVDPEIVNAVQEFLRNNMGFQYREVLVKGIHVCETAPKVSTDPKINKKSSDAMKYRRKQGNVKPNLPPDKILRDRILCVRVGGPGSHYCKNKADHHTTNTVYFVFRKGLCSQKCFSVNETPRAETSKKCSLYRSSPVVVPPSLCEKLGISVAPRRATSTAELAAVGEEKKSFIDINNDDKVKVVTSKGKGKLLVKKRAATGTMGGGVPKKKKTLGMEEALVNGECEKVQAGLESKKVAVPVKTPKVVKEGSANKPTKKTVLSGGALDLSTM